LVTGKDLSSNAAQVVVQEMFVQVLGELDIAVQGVQNNSERVVPNTCSSEAGMGYFEWGNLPHSDVVALGNQQSVGLTV